MIHMQLSEAAQALHGHLRGDDASFLGCGTDSRALPRRSLFVALRGPRFDGHDYVDQAKAQGAAAVLVDRNGIDYPLPALRVEDTRLALGRLASAWRQRFAVPVVAVTGSNGKTTVKELLRAILGQTGPVLATAGNLNNDIGLPLTLLGLGDDHRAAVVEMGANHPGEIASLTALAAPTVGLVTLCAPAHLEGFGSIEGVARAKGELFEHLDAGATAVLNADDPYAGLWRDLIGERRCVSFGLDAPADVSATRQVGSEITLQTPAGAIDTVLELPGRHNVMNACAAAAAALAAGAELTAIAAGIAATRPIAGRLEPKHGRNGARLIDDTYNANPGSLAAGLETLKAQPGHHWLVLGDMGELGETATVHHQQAAAMALAHGVDRLYATGELTRHTVAAFGPGGRHFERQQDLIEALVSELTGDVVVLLKGSRTMHMDRVVNALVVEDR